MISSSTFDGVLNKIEYDVLSQHPTALGLERIADKPWHVCACSAASGAGVADAVAWLARQLREPRRLP